MSSSTFRLSNDIRAVHYAIDIDTTPEREAFEGTVKISVTSERKLSQLTLHARDLEIISVWIDLGGQRIAATAQIHAEDEIVAINPERALPAGSWIIELQFLGKRNKNMHGLYCAVDGPDRAMVSQCEATDARAIFPCLDEPAFKASIQWTVRTDKGFDVITNGVLLSKHEHNQRIVHTFKTTPVISTYLAAITVGKYDATDVETVGHTPCRVLAGKGKKIQGLFAAEVTRHVLPWYESYFDHPYHYEKLDQVAVPGFDAGAMENVGAIFYRDSLLLMNPATTSWFAQKRIAEVIAHEIAHQWFGNLVTMQWWDDLWLNEAFATWIAYKAVDAWQPQWRMWDDYLASKERALEADALVHTHPIYTEVKTPAEATELFDLITYEKGCAVLRMAEGFLGEDTFKKGMRQYIDRFKNSNAQGCDLWESLSSVSAADVHGLMQSWVNQSGFPLLDIQVEQSNHQTVLHVHQTRFYFDAQKMQGDAQQTWQVPMVIAYDTGHGVQTQRVMLTEQKQSFALSDGDQPLWIYPNAGCTGFYRMHLDDHALNSLLKNGLAHLSPAERASLIEDRWALVRCGLATVSHFLDVLCAFRNDTDYVVGQSMTSKLSAMDAWLVTQEMRPVFEAFVQWIMAEQAEHLGWQGAPDEPKANAAHRASIVQALGEMGRHPETLEQAKVWAHKEANSVTSVDPNLAPVVLGLTALNGDAQMLDNFVALYMDRKNRGATPQEQNRYLYALASFENSAPAASVLALCLDGTVPQSHLRTLLVLLLRRRATQGNTWDFIKSHWDNIRTAAGAMGISSLVEATGALPLELQDDVHSFFEEHPVAEASRALNKALEAMSLRRSLVQRESKRLGTWLQQPRNSRFFLT